MDEPLQPAYLVVDIDEGGTCVGGLMVTDEYGLPLDFRFTDPITPTRLQRALYGGALERYLRADVVAGTLLSSIEVTPTLLLVDDEDLLHMPSPPCPVAVLDTTRISAIGPAGTVKGQDDADHVLLQARENVAPIRVTAASRDMLPAVTPALVSLFSQMDPQEPADRVRRALSLIAQGQID